MDYLSRHEARAGHPALRPAGNRKDADGAPDRQDAQCARAEDRQRAPDPGQGTVGGIGEVN